MSLPCQGWLERPWPRRSCAMQRKPLRCEVEHLRLPGVRAQRPAVAEADDRAGAPVLVVDLRAVLGGEGAHGSPFAVGGGGALRGRSRGRRVGGGCRQWQAERRCGSGAADEQPAAGGRWSPQAGLSSCVDLPSSQARIMHSYSMTMTLSGAQPPWKPNGTRTGRRIVATGSPAKSWASRMTTSLRSRFGS